MNDRMDVDVLRGAILEATFQGHDIGASESVENGYQPRGRLFCRITWLNDKGLRYTLLEDACEGEGRAV